jgi:hypothetical protein
MDNLIQQIHEIIGDYRKDEGHGVSQDRIKTWIDQFEVEDREFVLQELINIFKKRYISKERARQIVRDMILFLTKEEGYDDPRKFLKECQFIDHQPEGKSQKVLLEFLDQILHEHFGMNLSDCNRQDAKFHVYFDDILCTGDTIYKGLGMKDKGWYFQKRDGEKSNLDVVMEKKELVIWAYFAIHIRGRTSASKRLYMAAGKRSPRIQYAWENHYQIDNDFENENSSLGFLFPLETVKNEQVQTCENHIIQKVTDYCAENHYDKPKERFYRQNGLPPNETLFSSPANRERFERIMLEKCIEIYNSAKNDNVRMRPLGYGLKTDLSFGFGALIFTWRNIPFNVPMVFWYEHRGWTPLFDRKFVTYGGDTASLLPDK